MKISDTAGLPIRCTLVIAIEMLVASCGGGNGPDLSQAPPLFSVGGTVSGMTPGTEVTLNNGAESVTIAANGPFVFPVKLKRGASYAAAAANPPGHACSLKDAAGAVSANVTNIAVKCLPLTLAGAVSPVQWPVGVAIDANGNTFVLDIENQVIVKFTKTGVASILAGVKGVRGSQDGAGTAATFFLSEHSRVAIDGQGNLIVTELCNGLLRKITPAGMVGTLAGTRARQCTNYSGNMKGNSLQDGTGSAAGFLSPGKIVLDKNGDMLVVEESSPFVRRVTPAGVVTTERYFSRQTHTTILALAVDKAGTIYVAARGDSDAIWRIDGATPVLVAGGASWTGPPTLPADGSGKAAAFLGITALAIDNSGNLLVADEARIRKVTPAGLVTTLAGAMEPGAIDGTGGGARLGTMSSIAIDASGNAVVSQATPTGLRVVTPAGAVSTFAGAAVAPGFSDGHGAAARFSAASSLSTGPDGTLYMADPARHVIRKVSPAGDVSLFAGIPNTGGALDGPVGVATFNAPGAVAVDRNGVVYVGDDSGIRKIDAGKVTTLFGGTGMGAIFTMAVNADGNVVVSDSSTVWQVSSAGVRTTLVDEAVARAALHIGDRFNRFVPQGVVYDLAGNLYISDTGNIVVFKYSKAGVLSVFAGTPTVEGDADGPPGTASFGFYTYDWMTIDDGGNLYLGGQGKLRKISPMGVVSTPPLAWGAPNLWALGYYKGTLYGTTRYAILQLPVD